MVKDKINKDIDRAEYGQVGVIPTAGKSFSGWLFIACGALVGFFVALIVKINTKAPSMLCLIIFGLFAFAGQSLHGILKKER